MARDQNHKSFYTDENIKLRSPFQLLNTRNNFFKESQLRPCQCSEKHLHAIFGLTRAADRLSLRIHLHMGTVQQASFAHMVYRLTAKGFKDRNSSLCYSVLGNQDYRGRTLQLMLLGQGWCVYKDILGSTIFFYLLVLLSRSIL